MSLLHRTFIQFHTAFQTFSFLSLKTKNKKQVHHHHISLPEKVLNKKGGKEGSVQAHLPLSQQHTAGEREKHHKHLHFQQSLHFITSRSIFLFIYLFFFYYVQINVHLFTHYTKNERGQMACSPVYIKQHFNFIVSPHMTLLTLHSC